MAMPFALPDRRAAPATPLALPHYLVLLAGVLLVPFIIVVLCYPIVQEMLSKDDVLAHRAVFGFDVGAVATDEGHTSWGITAVTPGGLAERSGFRAGDVIRTYHGTPANFLAWALDSAARGTEACLDVSNMPVRLAGLRLDRAVCLGSARTADPPAPTCSLPSIGGTCRAPTGGAVLVARAPVHENGRHALVLRPGDGSPEILVRAFERSVDVLWAPDGRAVAITDHEASGRSTIWVHAGPLLSHQMGLTSAIAAALYFPDHFTIYPHRWEDAATLRLTAAGPDWLAPTPLHRFRYRLGAAKLTPVP